MQAQISTAFAILATLAAAAGCGEKSDQEQIKATYAQASSALSKADGASFCAALAPASAEAVASGGKNVTGVASCGPGVDRMLKAIKALQQSNWVDFCAAISPQLAQGIASSGKQAAGQTPSCSDNAAVLSKSPRAAKAFATIGNQLQGLLSRIASGKLTDIKVSGESASATVVPAQPGQQPVKFVRTEDGWKLVSTG
jgi:hypothetical protein